MSLRILAGLILANLVWSANPAMSKLVIADVGPASAAWVRYFGALVAYLGVALWVRTRQPGQAFFLLPARRREVGGLLLMAFMTFCFSPLTQMLGLHASTATENALIVAMEPLLTVALAWIFIHERVSFSTGVAFLVSIVGFLALAGVGPGNLWNPHFIGNFLILLSMVGEGTFSVVGRTLVTRHSALAVFGSTLLVGVLFLTGAVIIGWYPDFPGNLAHLSWRGVLAAFWIGPLGTTLGYLLWLAALRHATVASLVLTLFIQPVAGALWGLAFLDERLKAFQFLGAALILGAVFSQAARKK